MADGPFKSMSREKRQDSLGDWMNKYKELKAIQCEECGGWVQEGDWPWCKNGDPDTHSR